MLPRCDQLRRDGKEAAMTIETPTLDHAPAASTTSRPKKAVQHFKRPVEKPFTRDQRPYTTILFGGLTWSHERLIKGAWEGIGYKCGCRLRT